MAPTPDTIAQSIENFVRRTFRVPAADAGFHRDVHLYDSGYVDSVGVIELIAFLESTFEVQLQDDDLFSSEFTTINGISGVVHNSLQQRVPSGDAREAV